MFWSGMLADSKTNLVCVSRARDACRQGSLTDHRYITEILKERVVPYSLYNARTHTAMIMRDFLQEVGISVMQWLVRSPDLDLIEHLWGHLTCKVWSHDPAPIPLRELKDAVIEKRDTIPQEEI
ncbi:unnamed protein product [Euphydryas editha]|uniref:Tc1-like transposase DDE domain-containing protein n=1 Tax=Euphydryas editha TaxID=104508 RepID=A0AAU9TU14_EUPED|nr:unnamed protein product [Euphydryas editha]